MANPWLFYLSVGSFVPLKLKHGRRKSWHYLIKSSALFVIPILRSFYNILERFESLKLLFYCSFALVTM